MEQQENFLGGWNYYEHHDEFTDELTHVGAQVVDLSVAVVGYPNNNNIIFVIHPKYFIEDYDKTTEVVKIRIDKDKAETYYAHINRGDEQDIVFINTAHDLAKRMVKGNKMVVQVGDQDIMRISLQGSLESIEKVLTKCNRW